jgi:hypothetical protein
MVGTPVARQAVMVACAVGRRVAIDAEIATASGSVQVRHEVRRRELGAEVFHPEAAQPQYFRQQPRG